MGMPPDPYPHDLARHPVLLLAGVALVALALFVLLSSVIPDAAAFALAIPLATIAAVVGTIELGGLRGDLPRPPD